MAEVITVNIPEDTWVDVNTLSGIAEGTAFTGQNSGIPWIRLQESATQPTNNVEGKLITNLFQSSPDFSVVEGSGKIWARVANEGKTGSIRVQV